MHRASAFLGLLLLYGCSASSDTPASVDTSRDAAASDATDSDGDTVPGIDGGADGSAVVSEAGGQNDASVSCPLHSSAGCDSACNSCAADPACAAYATCLVTCGYGIGTPTCTCDEPDGGPASTMYPGTDTDLATAYSLCVCPGYNGYPAPSDTVETAIDLGSTTDCTDAASPGTNSSPAFPPATDPNMPPTVWLHYTATTATCLGSDTPFASWTQETTGRQGDDGDVQVCVFVKTADGRPTQGCDTGSVASNDLAGYDGCCTGASTSQAAFNDFGSLTGGVGADVYMRVQRLDDTSPAVCTTGVLEWAYSNPSSR